MALSTKTMRGFIRYLPGTQKGLATGRHVIYPDTTTPVYGNHVRPTSAPSGTGAKGDWYIGTDGLLYIHDGTAMRAQVNVNANQTLAGNNTFSGTNYVSGTLAYKRIVKTGAATLTAAESGALCLFNAAAGFTYTLPATAVGLWFDFLVTVTVTSVAAKVITPASSFIVGSFLQIPDTAAQIVAHAANGTTHVSWNGNGTTTGGYAGDRFRLTAISSTVWAIEGIGLATGSEATPFATS